MEYRYLGSSGLQVSALSLGSWITFGEQAGEEQCTEIMKAAYDAGVNFFDNAEVYAGGQAEVIMGKIIKRAGWKRSDLVISTKIFMGGPGPNDQGLSRKHILEGTEASLARLQMEYVDLLYCHRPDPHTPIEETVRAMTYLVNKGKALYWGTSEWSSTQILTANHIARRERLVPPTMEQVQYNMFHRERVEKEYASLVEQIGLGVTIWSPLAGGMLTGKYNESIPVESRAAMPQMEEMRPYFESEEAKHRIEKIRQLMEIADQNSMTMAQLALGWCLKNPRVSSVITGASNPPQVSENMKALDASEKLTPLLLEQIETILNNKP